MTQPEIDAAQRKLDDAVRDFMVGDSAGGTLTSYVVLAHVLAFDDKADSYSFYPVGVMHGDQPRYQSVGLLELGREALDVAAYSHDHDEDENE